MEINESPVVRDPVDSESIVEVSNSSSLVVLSGLMVLNVVGLSVDGEYVDSSFVVVFPSSTIVDPVGSNVDRKPVEVESVDGE